MRGAGFIPASRVQFKSLGGGGGPLLVSSAISRDRTESQGGLQYHTRGYSTHSTRLTQAGSLGTRILDNFFHSTLSAMREDSSLTFSVPVSRSSVST